jgi:hypothetical protein
MIQTQDFTDSSTINVLLGSQILEHLKVVPCVWVDVCQILKLEVDECVAQN